MEELFIATAKLMNEETLLEELTKALENYKVFRTKESEHKLTMFMMLLISKYTSQKETLGETLKRFEEFKSIHNLFKNKKN